MKLSKKEIAALRRAIEVLRNLDSATNEELLDLGCQPTTAIGTLENIADASEFEFKTATK